MAKNPYFDEAGKPKLYPSFCVYMDVLGFSERIREAHRLGTSESLFAEFYSATDAAISHLKSDTSIASSSPDLWTVKVFTDNVVLGLPHTTQMDSEAEFGFITYFVSHYQREMATRGFFVRGAMTVGDLHVGDNVVFGQALLDAYSLESVQARDPRIILSSGVMALVDRHLKYYGDPSQSPQNAFIFLDADGLPFLNYLGTSIDDDAGRLVAAWDEVARHKSRVEANLAKFKAVPNVWAKYNWVANYHDFFCREVAHLGGYVGGLKIDSPYHRVSPSRLIKKP